MRNTRTLYTYWRPLAVVIGLGCWLLDSPPACAQQYNVRDLGVQFPTNSYAYAINHAGAVVGYWDSVTNGIHAFLYTNGVTADLGALGGTNAYALSINASNQIVGFYTISNSIRAFRHDGAITNLGGLGGDNSYAFGINASGKIVGYVDTTNGARAFYLDGGALTNLGTLGGTNSYAYAVNVSNLTAGASLITGNSAIHAFLWAGSALSNLNDLSPGSGWVLQEARALNDAGVIVGWGTTNSQERAFAFSNGSITDLGFLSGGTNSYALGVNNSNHVVGAASIGDGIERAFRWKDGVMTNLNSVIRADLGWDLREARSINDSGQIVGWGTTNGQEHAFLLTPNNPPTVSLTDPANNSTFNSPTNLVLTATAADDAYVSKVEFFEGSTKIGEDTTSPYSITWKYVVAGSYSLTARATDDLGAVSTSSVVNITVTLPATNALKLWLKADAITGLNDGDPVGTWSDSSGLGNNATGSGSTRPAYKASIVNSKPIVRFDGSDDYLTLPSLFTSVNQAEVFVVLKATADVPAGSRGLWQFGNSGAGLVYPLSTGVIMDDFGSTTSKTLGDPSQPLNQFHLYNVSAKTNDWAARLNGVVQYSSTTNIVHFGNSPWLGFASTYFSGDIAEMLLYKQVLSEQERLAVGSYLARKYAVTASVPAAPSNLTATAVSPSQISLAWQGSLGIESTAFSIERKLGSGGTYAEIAQVRDATSFLDTGLSASTQYYYRVRAVNFTGESDYSNEASATTLASGADVPLANLKLWLKADAGIVIQTTNSTIGRWLDQSGAGNHSFQDTSSAQPRTVTNALGGRPITRFDATSDSLNFQKSPFVGATQAEVFVVLKAAADVPNNYRTLWYFGNGATLYPSSSYGYIAEQFGSTTWRDVRDPFQPLDQYHIYNVSAKTNDWAARFNGVVQQRFTSNWVSFSSSPALGGAVGYYFDGDIAELLIYNQTLNSDEREAVGRYLHARYTLFAAPLTPTNLTATAIASNQVSLAWQGSFTNISTAYVLERKEGPSGTYAVVAVLNNNSSCIDTGLTAGVTYYYRVKARNYGGESAYSSEASATPVAGKEPIPFADVHLWLKGDSGHGVGPISTWLDESGRNNDAYQTTSSSRPQALNFLVNGRPAMRFDASDDMFDFPYFLTGLTQAEVFVVLKAAVDTPTGYRGLWRFGGVGATYYPQSDGTIRDDFGSTTAKSAGNPALLLDQFHLYNVSSQANEWTSRINGLVHYATTNNAVSFSPSYRLAWSSSTYFAGDIAELIICNRVLSAGEREAVGKYLGSKYALVAAPATPTSLTATAIASNQVSVTWLATITNSGTRFVLERKTGAGGTYAVLVTLEDTLSWLDTNVVAGTEYFYRVKAVNFGGESGYSNEASATPTSGRVMMPLSNILLWLKADAGHGSGAVSLWLDQSGQGNHASQSTISSYPQAIASGANGRPVIRFDASNDYFDFNNFLTGVTQAEVFVVLKAAVDTPTGYRGLWRFGGVGATYYPQSDGTICDDFGSTTAKFTGNPALLLDQFHLYNVSSQTNEWTSRINGLVHHTTTNNAVSFVASYRLGWSASTYFAGDIAELILCNRVLSAEEREAVGRYVVSKYALMPIPGAPTNLTATAIGSNQVSLTWTATITNFGTRFVVERKAGSGGTYAALVTLEDALSHLDTNAVAGTEYFYRVKAVNDAGESGYSNEASATTTAGQTSVPLADMLLWLKADAGHGPGAVGFWLDQSSRGNHASQSTLSSYPQAVSTNANGRPAIRFDGTNDALILPNQLFDGVTNAEAFVVLKASVDTPASARALWRMGGAASSSYPNTDGTLLDDFGSTTAKVMADPPQALDQVHLYNASSKTNEWTSRINGLVHHTTTNNAVLFSASYMLGWCHPYYFAGDIAEVIICNRVLTTDERDAVGRYLGRKYALVASPAVPSNLVAHAVSSNHVSLIWESGFADSALTFAVERKAGSGGSYQTLARVENGISYLDTNATAGTQFFYRVKAFNFAGESNWSNEADATPVAAQPSMPLDSLVVWLKGDSGHGLGPISFWRDYSGWTNHAAQDSSAPRPVTVLNAINGRAAIRFDGTNDQMGVRHLLASNDFTIVAVAKTGIGHEIDAEGSGAGYTGQKYLFDYTSFLGSGTGDDRSSVGISLGTNGISVYEYQWNTGTAAFEPALGVYEGPVGTNFSIVAMTHTGRQPRIYRNGIMVRAGLTYSREPVFAPVRIGTFYTNAFSGDVGEILIFRKVLSIEEMDAVGVYLNKRFTLITSVPTIPTNFLATAASPTQISLTWSNPPPNGTTVYLVERKTGIGGTFGLIGSARDTNTFLDYGVIAGTTYFYRVKATNYFGQSDYSIEISPPITTITNPLPQSVFSIGSNVTVSAVASDSDGSINQVEFLVDGTVVGTLTNSPYSLTLTNLASGVHTLLTRAKDNQGHTRFSAPIGITVVPDTDGDGINDFDEIVRGTDPTRTDTDGDGVSDAADAFPLDPTRTSVPSPDPMDTTPPTIILDEPSEATPIP